jgi:hypothetical protein
MALNFPASPTVNQIYTSGALSYRWTGSAWVGITNIQGPIGNQGTQGTQGIGYAGLTSASSLAISSGAVTFTTNYTQAQSAFVAGTRVRASAASNTANFMEGTISNFSGTSLTISVDTTAGSGTFTSWNFSVAGLQGTQGAQGISLSVSQNSGSTVSRPTGINFVNTSSVTVSVSSAPDGNANVAFKSSGIYDLDDISSNFDGITKSFVITYNGGTPFIANTPDQFDIMIGGVKIYPTKYLYDYVDLTEISVFTRGFYVDSVGNVNFATAPSQPMSFYGTVLSSNSGPPFVYANTPFTALNIMLTY